jgi:predicted NAD/FAD-dependent oxidoreductase
VLDLIRELDARADWNNGSRSCAAWLSGLAHEALLTRRQ